MPITDVMVALRRHLWDGPGRGPRLTDSPAQVEKARRVVKQPDPLLLFPLLGHLSGRVFVVFRVKFHKLLQKRVHLKSFSSNVVRL